MLLSPRHGHVSPSSVQGEQKSCPRPRRLIGAVAAVPWHPAAGRRWQAAKVITAEWSSPSPQRAFMNRRVRAGVQESGVFRELGQLPRWVSPIRRCLAVPSSSGHPTRIRAGSAAHAGVPRVLSPRSRVAPGFGRERRWRCECGAEPAATRSPPAQQHLPLISSNYCPFPFIMINTCRLRWIKYWLPLNIFTNTHTHTYIFM